MAEGKASKDPVQFPVKPTTNTTQPDPNVGLAELAQLARQAFEENRRKQSMGLANAILKIDPEHKQALVIRSWIQSDLQNDLSAAKAMLEEAQSNSNRGLFERAEISCRTILNIDSDNDKARDLLKEVTTAQKALAPLPGSVAGEEGSYRESAFVLPLEDDEKPKATRWLLLSIPALVIILALFVLKNRTSPPDTDVAEKSDATTASAASTTAAAAADSTLGSFEIVTIPSPGVQMTVDNNPPQPAPPRIELPAGEHRFVFTAHGYQSQTFTKTIAAGQRALLPVVMDPVSATADVKSQPAPREQEPPARPPKAPADTPAAAAPAAVGIGSLAVSAALPVDVYMNGKRMGATPLTLDLPPGMQTLEYRYQGIEKMVSYMIKPGETIRASVAFDVTLQINARPWALVSIEGSQAKELGQTPLSNVAVPVGSVLVFQNPSFGEKKYRVTGKDSTVQIVFP